jgi:hypothetical protein
MKVYSQFKIVHMFVEHMIVADMLEASSEFLKLMCIKGLRETEQCAEIMRYTYWKCKGWNTFVFQQILIVY